jgi:hypothetical protein
VIVLDAGSAAILAVPFDDDGSETALASNNPDLTGGLWAVSIAVAYKIGLFWTEKP